VTAVEYGLILALIAGVIITGLLLLGPAISSLFSSSANCVSAPSGCPGGP
jgi:Flp pilus assembly pilin Flp